MATAKNKKEPPIEKPAKETAKVIKASGLDYLYDFFGYIDYWDVSDLDLNKIIKYKENVYSQKIASSLANMIFQGSPIINILDPKGNSREDVAEWYRAMLSAPAVNFEDKLHRTIDAWFYLGNFIHSDTIEFVDGKFQITEIRDLPPESFGAQGTYSITAASNQASIVTGRFLKGIVRDEDGTIRYYQTQANSIVEIENCTHIKAPKYGYFLDGIPLLNPLYKLIPKMSIAWDSLMQCGHRNNNLFLRVNKIGTMPDNKTSNWNYCNKVLQSYNRNVFFTLPPEVEPIELKGPVSDISVKTIEMLTELMISLYSASDFISKKSGTMIGGSTTGESNLFKNTIVGIQTKLIQAWTPLLTKVLEWNGYLGYKVELLLPEPEYKNEELDFKKGQELLKSAQAGLVVASINEIRSYFGMEDANEEFIKKAKEEWESAKISAMESPVTGKESSLLEEKNQTENKESQGNQGSKNKLTRSQDDNEDVGISPDELKRNQGSAIPTLDEIGEEVVTDLVFDVEKFFSEIKKLNPVSLQSE